MAHLIYLASPYRAFPLGKEAAAKMACRVVAFLRDRGVFCISPVAHSHYVAEHAGIDPDLHDYWMEWDRAFMDACAGMIEFRATGWNKSRGMAEERAIFKAAGKPVIPMNARSPLTIPPEVLEWTHLTGLSSS